ncbi:hypothetical protein P7K49_003836 [Saguinus oedipus]|uniref:Uncharacterized protein n=1 Tax=Saguinus oedipus TaxID=9490 RepID=A0ABQ9W643_SAGOE|nr:hypothetical protein P7K49_003836 [Saguinus oedipus]
MTLILFAQLNWTSVRSYLDHVFIPAMTFREKCRVGRTQSPVSEVLLSCMVIYSILIKWLRELVAYQECSVDRAVNTQHTPP